MCLRTALKLRRLQRALLLHRLPLAEAVSAFQSAAWRLPDSGQAAVPDLLVVLTELYSRLQPPLAGEAALALRVDLCLNWLIGLYDRSAPISASIADGAIGYSSCLFTVRQTLS